MPSNQTLFCIVFIFLSFASKGQIEKNFFPLSREYKPWGFIVSPELNKQFAFTNFNETITFNDSTNYNYNLGGSSKVGFGGEIGGFYAFKRAIPFHFIESNLGYRRLQSSTPHQGTLNSGDSTSSYRSDNEYRQQLLHLSVRATHVLQLKRYSMLFNSIGINANYVISETKNRSENYPSIEEKFTSNPSLQLHYELGFGYRINKYIILTPSIGTSLLTLYPFESLETGFQAFNQSYQPIFFKLRVFILQKDPINCNSPSYKGPAHLN